MSKVLRLLLVFFLCLPVALAPMGCEEKKEKSKKEKVADPTKKGVPQPEGDAPYGKKSKVKVDKQIEIEQKPGAGKKEFIVE